MVVFTIKELDIMKEKKIKLVSIADAKTFVTAAMKCDFDVDVFYNRVVIDGKSIRRTEYGSDQNSECKTAWGKRGI